MKPVASIRGGAHAPHFKDTAEKESVAMTSPPMVILPIQQHIGAPCKPLVKVGEAVSVGQVVADSEGFVSAPIHATVSGKVKAIKPILGVNGQKCDAIHIENDGLDTISETVKPPEIKDKNDFLKAVRASGLVGLGGAGFPLHVKLAVKEGTVIDTLAINGAECEPYITSDYRESMEFPERILNGIQKVMEYVGIERCLIGIEDNKPKSIELLGKLSAQRGSQYPISVVELPSRYPHGAEKMLIYAMTGRRVPLGSLPMDVGCVVMNICSVSLLAEYLETGMPLVKKRLTVAGGAVRQAQNVIAPIGTPIKDIIEFCGGYEGEAAKIIMGGPMMGIAQYEDAVPITKPSNAILALTKEQTFTPEDTSCIHCGRCVEVCPMSLMPTLIEKSAKKDDAAALKKLGVSGCMECGSCAFACPARRPLVQHLRYAKTVERKAVAK